MRGWDGQAPSEQPPRRPQPQQQPTGAKGESFRSSSFIRPGRAWQASPGVGHESVAEPSLAAKVEEGDPGFDDPLPITIGLWFTGAWTLWNTLTPAQQEVTDPDFAAEARLGSELSNLDVQRLVLRRGELGSRMRQLMQDYDLVVTPSVAVPAFEARPAGHTPMSAEAMLGWTPFSYPFNLTQQPACTIPCGLTSDGLPIGMQLVGPMFNDALVLRAARAYETARPIPRPTIGRG